MYSKSLILATLVGFSLITNAQPTSHLPSHIPLSSLSTHHRSPLKPRSNNFKRDANDPTPGYGPILNAPAMLYYFTASGNYTSQTSVTSEECIPLPLSGWEIVQVYPLSGPTNNNEHQILNLFNDQACSNQSQLRLPPLSEMIVVNSYFTQQPIGSIKWTRFVPTSTVLSPTPTSTVTSPTPTSTPADLTNFPPPPINAYNNDGKWDRGKGNGNTILIVAITVTCLAIGLIAIGALYIYKTFYAAPESTSSCLDGTTAATKATTSRGSKFGKSTSSRSSSPIGLISTAGSSHSKAVDYNDSYVYNHDEDENTPPKFMFNHKLDNINTDNNPKNYRGS